MNDMTPELAGLGDALECATAADLARTAPNRRGRKRLAVAAIALVIAVPGIAYAAGQLISNDEVAASMPAGTLALAGTEPTCTVVRQDVEFHCVLAKAPAIEVTDAQGNPKWKGTVEPSVDASKHVNGGCRGLTNDGLEWQCYIGQAAVDQQIISQGFLGE